jgi:hypothetical protein
LCQHFACLFNSKKLQPFGLTTFGKILPNCGDLGSISSTFNVTLEDPRKDSQVISVFLSFWDLRTKKAARKTLVKLTPGVNFINILRTVFYSYVSALLFLGPKYQRKMLMKLTPVETKQA